MGNSQSAEAPRRPTNKLSKPKTNNSTPNLLGSSSNLLSSARPSQADLKTISKRPSFISTKGTITTENAEEAPAAPKEKPPRRLGLFRSKSSNSTPSSVPLPDPIDPEQRMPNLENQLRADPLRRYSQRVSVNYDVTEQEHYPLHDTRLSKSIRRPTPDTPYSRQTSRLSLAVDTKSLQSQEAEGPKQGQASRKNSSDNRKSILSPPPSESLDTPVTANIPIRRRSLQTTPGIATRHSWARETLRRSVASQQDVLSFSTEKVPVSSQEAMPHPVRARTMPAEDRMPHYRQSVASSFALEDIPAVVAELEMPSPRNVSEPRTSTPNELEYRHIGTHKFGSLRITNGSPGPDSGDDASIRQRQRGDSVEEVSGRRMFSQTKVIISKRSRIALNQHEEVHKEPAVSVVDVQPDKMTQDVSVAELYGDEPPNLTELRMETSYESLRVFNFHHAHSDSLQVQFDPSSPTRAFELAQAYIAEIASSPFIDETPPATPQLESTSKHTALEDHLFDDEHESVKSPQLDETEFPPRSPVFYNDDSAAFDTFVVDRKRLSRWSMDVSVNTVERKPMERHGKADSGYNSNESLSVRSSTKSRSTLGGHSSSFDATNAPIVPDKEPPPTPPKDTSVELTSPNVDMSFLDQFKQEVEEHLSTNAANAMYSYGIALSSGLEQTQTPVNGPSPSKPTRHSHFRGKSWTSLIGSTKSKEDTPTTPPRDSKRGVNVSRIFSSKTSSDLARRIEDNELPAPPLRAPPPVPSGQPSGIETRMESVVTSAAETAGSKSPRAISRPHNLTQSHSMPVIGQAISTPVINGHSPQHSRSDSDTSVTSASNKLRKNRPSSQPVQPQLPPTVQAYYEIEPDRVPAVPQGMMVALEGHLHKYPPLTNPSKSLQRMNSKETLTTIFSVGSAEHGGQNETASLFSRIDRSSVIVPSNEEIERRINQPIRPFPIRSETVPSELGPMNKNSTEVTRSAAIGNRSRHSVNKAHGPQVTRSNALRRSSFQTGDLHNREQLSQYSHNSGGIVQPQRQVGRPQQEVTATKANGTYHGASFDQPANAIEETGGTDNVSGKSPTSDRDDRDQLPSRRISMDSSTASQFARDRSRAREERRRSITPRRSFGPEPSTDGRGDLLSQPARPKSIVDEVPPVPVLPVDQAKTPTAIQKTKSPPPVSMATQRMGSPMKPHQNRPQRMPTPPIGNHNMNPNQYSGSRPPSAQQAKIFGPSLGQPLMWREQRTSTEKAMWPPRPAVGGSLPPPRPPFLKQQVSQPQLHGTPRRRSDQNLHYSSQARQFHQPMILNGNTGRTSTMSTTGPNRMSQEQRRPQSMYHQPLQKSRSQSSMQGDQLVIDRYSGGLPYGLEFGIENSGSYGLVGGSGAGMRNRISGMPQRKPVPVPGSNMWAGVDLSDVPMVVSQHPKRRNPVVDPDDDDYI